MEINIVVYLVIFIGCGFIGGAITESKGRSFWEGFAEGFFLNFIGIILVAFLPKNEKILEQEKLKDGTSKKCPYCAEVIKREATVCRYCGKDLPVEEIQQSNEIVSDPAEVERRRVEKLGIEIALCPNCQTLNSLSLWNCEKCNTSLEKVKPIRNPYI